ncbi:uncharacterized protein EV154DRAFT_580365 [Mucor mucedo]|uniref:uncharacterized protein n=1 Tax=Mucor mucedo TaxID=29922 RepID=UPI002220AF02|nr:uncharacterized protein EV154DRAFT_580365 [Mucor mucedo]KAI7871115.1 hypothetical protein EV154DRAFT_580365 [Mucor mucedo]
MSTTRNQASTSKKAFTGKKASTSKKATSSSQDSPSNEATGKSSVSWYGDQHLTKNELNPDGLTSIDILMGWITRDGNFSKWRGEKNDGMTTAANKTILCTYRKAETWRNQTGQGILDSATDDNREEKEISVLDTCIKKYKGYTEIEPFFRDSANSVIIPFNEDADYDNVEEIMFGNDDSESDAEFVQHDEGPVVDVQSAPTATPITPTTPIPPTTPTTPTTPTAPTNSTAPTNPTTTADATTPTAPTTAATPITATISINNDDDPSVVSLVRSTSSKKKRLASHAIVDTVLESSERPNELTIKRMRVLEREVNARIEQDLFDRNWRQEMEEKKDDERVRQETKDAADRKHQERQVAMANLGLLISNKMITKEEYFAEIDKLNNHH